MKKATPILRSAEEEMGWIVQPRDLVWKSTYHRGLPGAQRVKWKQEREGLKRDEGNRHTKLEKIKTRAWLAWQSQEVIELRSIISTGKLSPTRAKSYFSSGQ